MLVVALLVGLVAVAAVVALVALVAPVAPVAPVGVAVQLIGFVSVLLVEPLVLVG